jgi:4-hydroxyphenylpyruvate dioxygenase
MAQKYGYSGVEIFHEDLADLPLKLQGDTQLADPGPEAQLSAAQRIRSMCRARGLDIISLQPLMNYEGLLDRAEHSRRLPELRLWIALCHELGTDLILVPSNFLPAEHLSDDLDLIAADLREAADFGAAAYPPIRFCYESLCWGTHVDVWETSWEIVKRIDRPNFGLCLDTFNIAGRIFADPSHPSGRNPDAEKVVSESMARLVAEVDPSKVFLVQVVDAERLAEPLIEGHEYYNAAQPCRMSWSRNCRLFYGEERAYLPVREIAWAIFNGLGYEGWTSLELFNRRMSESDPEVPEELARRGVDSWRRLVRDVGIKVAPPTSSVKISASL